MNLSKLWVMYIYDRNNKSANFWIEEICGQSWLPKIFTWGAEKYHFKQILNLEWNVKSLLLHQFCYTMSAQFGYNLLSNEGHSPCYQDLLQSRGSLQWPYYSCKSKFEGKLILLECCFLGQQIITNFCTCHDSCRGMCRNLWWSHFNLKKTKTISPSDLNWYGESLVK